MEGSHIANPGATGSCPGNPVLGYLGFRDSRDSLQAGGWEAHPEGVVGYKVKDFLWQVT